MGAQSVVSLIHHLSASDLLSVPNIPFTASGHFTAAFPRRWSIISCHFITSLYANRGEKGRNGMQRGVYEAHRRNL
jgi:hypothetical protein